MTSFVKQFVVRHDDGTHRQATWLELFFDLAFVISIATLSHLLIESPSWTRLGIYFALLAPVWWLWNQFTWYVSHFDNDDCLFRIMMLSSIAVVVFLSTTLHGVVEGHADAFVISYLTLHLVLAFGWIRAWINLADLRPYAQWKLTGIAAGIVIWTISIFVHPPNQYVLWAIGFALQLLLPILGWRSVRKTISVHYRHISERHGLFAIIVLGETLIVLASGFKHPLGLHMLIRAVPAFLIIASIWWIYFDWDYESARLVSTRNVFAFNYGHFFIYGIIGASAAGLALLIASETKESVNLSLFGRMIIAGSPAAYLTALAVMNLASYGKGMWKRALPRFVASALLVVYAVIASSLDAVTFAFGVAALMMSLIVIEGRKTAQS